ncbi:nucleoside deaminase [Kineosporia succinea]|uniref:tRNA(Arg) A34 adenosine deaminase TadA n=1 Tax=Kineosporia succinea TaxID=84632 RepID=A0ABT9P1V0_9ACTN|nr:nucleoside deaminase [Kineosporia succinea]MDP9826661.1 tRNA(Arg) A34 adenosine deaminase TadA [Kineosporia succinea]
MSTRTESDWLDQAISLAAENVERGGGPFGALIVRNHELVATGTNQVTPTLDPTAHAEVVAIRAACQALGTFKLDGCLLVASCEPCPMCFASSMWARVDRIVYAADRDDAARAGFDDRAFYEVFANDSSTWPLTLAQVPVPDATLPFSKWEHKADRTDY